MPTRDRPAFALQAIAYFLRQDYAERELVIVDDGVRDLSDLIPRDNPMIRYIRQNKGMSLGEKRNLALEMSRGEYVAHWDDDDWMSPDRLSRQVREIQQADADITGLRSVLYYKADSGEAWSYSYPDNGKPWLHGATLLYKRSIGVEHSFPTINVGEDSGFLHRISGRARFHAIADSVFYVGIIHGGNTSGKNTAGPCWRRGQLREVTTLLASDRDFYARVRSRNEPTRVAPQSTTSHVTVAGYFDVSTGYGSMSEYTVLSMARAGAHVDVVPLSLHGEGLTPEFHQIVRRSAPDRGSPTLYCGWPRPELLPFLAYQDLFMYTMWESAQLPAGWADQINRTRGIMVPSHFVADTYRRCGVTVPIEVVPEGVDPSVYPYVRREPRRGLVTLTIGPIDDRKHVQEGIAAWKLAFRDDPDARLIIKTTYGYRNYTPDDPRIRYVDQQERTRGILHWYRQADVLLALGNEGFGLPLIEGMATGMPVIALDSEGQSDVCREARDFLIPVQPASWNEYDSRSFGRCGLRGVPGVEDVAMKLRWVNEHREEAQQMGAAASAWVHRHRNVWNKGPAVLEMMERHVSTRRPLLRPFALWTTSFGGRCGVAEYTNSLRAGMSRQVRASAHPPNLLNVQLLHIQHEGGLFHESDMSRVMQQAHDVRVPVVVTEHSIDARVRAWEKDANALVSLSAAGAEQLRAKLPGRRVEHIPHGCPTWFPPRKQRRGRVLGVFGFLDAHKGFRDLLEVLRALPGTELLMFSHAKGEDAEREWNEASHGLPVRRIGGYLPEEEVARRLAAEADVLVFPYREVGHVSVSGAARVGLATGVPVLCSPTGWFADLKDVTHQTSDLKEGVARMLEDDALRNRLVHASKEFCHESSWSRVAEKHLTLWRSLATS
ncbi:glycosyltransferase [Granulicella sp. WH15]|uniref:glycosyltransferase n=1 Tax=Granulicella sp. WH15 TaxID=2602070 RepID=UPI001366A203|nr:glycosyltransferase [Granulicella sp. WH15]QHN04128.1 glycosyltransferase [Granulicella sp. WH15]